MAPRKQAKSDAPVRTSSRRSGAPTQLVSLNLYTKGKVTEFNSDENHNGLKADPVTPRAPSVAAPAKRRSQAPTTPGSNKRQRAVSPAGSHASSSTVAMTSAKRRGRPPGSANKATPASAAGRKKPGPKPGRKKAQQEKNKDEILAEVKDEPLSEDEYGMDDDEEEEADAQLAALAQKSSAPRQPRASRAATAAPKTPAARPAPSVASASGHGKGGPNSLGSVIYKAVAAHSQLNAHKTKEVSGLLEGLCTKAATMTSFCYDDVVHNLRTAEKIIVAAQRMSDTNESQVAATAHDAAKFAADCDNLAREVQVLRKTLSESQEDVVKMQRLYHKSEIQVRDLKQQLQQQAAAGPSSAASGSSASAASSSRDRAGASTSSALVPRPPLQQQTQRYNLHNMPRGSAIGHTTMAGRAGELIQGLEGVAGVDDSMASVAVTAATMPEYDEHGNLVQRTIRTRVERIEVTADMDIEELQRMGFEVVAEEGEDDASSAEDEESSEDGTLPEAAARIEEIATTSGEEDDDDDDEMMGGGEGDDGDGPLIDEAE